MLRWASYHTAMQPHSPLACIVEEAVKPIGPSQNLVAQMVHPSQRAQVGYDAVHPLTLPVVLDELDGLLYGRFSAAMDDNARAFLGESRGRVPAIFWGGIYKDQRHLRKGNDLLYMHNVCCQDRRHV